MKTCIYQTNLFRLNALDENNVPFQVENYNLSFNEKCDKMHASYCKFVLNLDKFTSNFAARAELETLQSGNVVSSQADAIQIGAMDMGGSRMTLLT